MYEKKGISKRTSNGKLIKSSPVSGLTDVPFVEIIQYFFTEIFFSFRYGPGKLASIQEEFEKTRELTKEDFYQIIKK